MRTNYYIINLKRFGDIFQSAHLVASIKNENPNCKINYICFEETKNAVEIINYVDEIFALDRKKITSFLKSPIYSDGLALDELETSLSKIVINDHDHVINYSNDRLSTFLTSFLTIENQAQFHGLRFNKQNIVEYSSPAATILNDIETSFTPTPFSFNDCYHKILGLSYKWSQRDPNTIKTNPTHDQSAAENLMKLKHTKSFDADSVKIVGIQLTSSNELKDICERSIINLISHIQESSHLVPIMLIAPTDDERELANHINTFFGDTLVSVEADFRALPSVLSCTDLVITPDTSVKHLCDAVGTSVLEISLGYSPFLKQGSINPNSLIMTFEPSVRIFNQNAIIRDDIIHQNTKVSGQDIYIKCCEMLNVSSGLENKKLNDTIVCYKNLYLNDDSIYLPIDGGLNPQFEFRRVMGRLISEQKTTVNQKIKKVIDTFGASNIQNFCLEEKKSLTATIKLLLSTLRSNIQTQEKHENAPSFVEHLERLLAGCYQNDLSSIPLLFFRARIETISSTTFSENLKEVEREIYNLKKQLQGVLSLIQEVETGLNLRESSAPRKREATL